MAVKPRRRVVIHEDDVGMTHGSNTAFVELSAMGSCSTGSVMVPCPWFAEVVELAHANKALDLGVHLTLTSEKKPYRWRPLIGSGKSSGLVNEMGYFWPDVPEVLANAVPEAVEAELRAQIDTALRVGLDVTHLDAHMGTVVCAEYIDIFVRLGKEYRMPIVLAKNFRTFNTRAYAAGQSAEKYEAAMAEAKRAGVIIFDYAKETPWNRETDAETAYHAIFSGLPDGLSFLAFHFNAPGDYEVVEPEFTRIRTDEYALFKSGKIAGWVRDYGLEVVGMRWMRDAMRA